MPAVFFRPKRLAEAVFIGCNQTGGRRENMFRGAVIALEANDFRAGKIRFKAQDIIDLCSAPTVNRLVIIANNADII